MEIFSKKVLLLSVGCINYNCDINFYEPLKKLFPDAINYNYVERLKQIDKNSMNKEVLDLIVKGKPDYVFFISYRDQITTATLDKINELGAKIVAWFSDDYWRFDLYSKLIAPHLFCSVTTDKHAPKKYKELNLNVIKSQWAANPDYYRKMPSQFLYDVSFIGQGYGIRKENINYLRDTGVSISVFGRDFGGYISFDEMVKIFNTTKINLNFSGSSYNGTVKHIHGRVFEVLMCGGFLLTEYTEGIEDYFVIGKEIECFESMTEAVEKIEYYLKHEDKRVEIAEAGHTRAMKDHTWENRLKNIFCELEKF